MRVHHSTVMRDALKTHLVLPGVTNVLLYEGSPGVGEGTEAVGDAVALATVILIDGGEILILIQDFRRFLNCVLPNLLMYLLLMKFSNVLVFTSPV